MFTNNYKVIKPYIKQVLRRMSTESCKIAVCQFTATNIKDNNLKIVQKLVSEAAKNNARIVFLPEGCDYIASSKTEIHSLAETLDGPLITEYKALAQEHKLWLSIGGFHEVPESKDVQKKPTNSHILINDAGEIQAVYRKLHLFDVCLPEESIDLKESDYVTKGDKIVTPVKTPAGLLSLLICYDLRFPEISIISRKLGAAILTFPSAFTDKTGVAHWEILLRSRAIENQCYVIAAAQYGRHNLNRTSYGQAMVIDPWGNILAECPKYTQDVPVNESIAYAEIDLNYLQQVRKEMPVFQHRREDVYKLNSAENVIQLPKIKDNYMFADKAIPPSQVFYVKNHTYAFTNIRCVVPGHVLIASLRYTRRLEDLTAEELTDFFETVVKVQKVLEKVYSASSSTICVQDGKDAGQTVPHVHCHVLPRKFKDFECNDDIYLKLAKHDRDDNTEKFRTTDEMAQEAELLRSYF